MDVFEPVDLFRRHAGLIQRVAHAYCRTTAEREDVVQEIAVALWRSRHRYDPGHAETTWVYRVALNVAISFHRRERRHRERREPDDVRAITIAAPVEEPDEDLERLQRCIDVLGALDRALVLLHLDGNDHATIAQVLGLSVSNVGTRLQRVRGRLRSLLERQAPNERTEIPDAAR